MNEHVDDGVLAFNNKERRSFARNCSEEGQIEAADMNQIQFGSGDHGRKLIGCVQMREKRLKRRLPLRESYAVLRAPKINRILIA